MEVTCPANGRSTVFWLGGYAKNEMCINPEGTFDPAMLNHYAFIDDLVDHLNYEPDEDELRWKRNSAFKSATLASLQSFQSGPTIPGLPLFWPCKTSPRAVSTRVCSLPPLLFLP
jgi:hypothetical protein